MLAALKTGLAALTIDLTDIQQQKLLDYLTLLNKWNKAYNLTAIRDPKQMLPLHLLDSLSILPYLHGTHHLDVGTGAGLPGIPLAIAKPEHHFTLLDSNGKKTRFLTHVQHQLGLTNIEVIQSRVEQYQPEQTFDTITTRAFSDLIEMVALTKHLLAPQGIWLAMKGQLPEHELQLLAQQGLTTTPYALKVPGVDASRLAIVIKSS